MFCKNCGQPMNDNQAICLNCGVKTGEGTAFCANCGAQVAPGAAVCTNCGVATAPQKPLGGSDNWVPAGKDKVVIIILCLLLGGFGIHNFYLGETKKGVLKILLCWTGISGILALVDLIKMIMGSYEVNAEKFI